MSDAAWRRELFPKTGITSPQVMNASIYSNQRRAERCEQGRRSVKIQLLMNKLKKAGNQSTIECSHLTNSMTHLKESKSVLINKPNFLQDFRARISKLFAQHGQDINELEEVINLLIYRQRQEASCEGRSNQTNIEVHRLENILEQIRLKVSGKQVRKALGSFHDIFRTPSNRKMSGIYQEKSRKETINSVFRDGSLLLSFKKNLQEDDGYATLKYSQQSNQKHQQKEGENIKQVKMDKRFNRRITQKSEQDAGSMPEPAQYDLKFHLKGVKDLQSTKVAIQTKKKQIHSAFGIYEQLLQKFIEAIAQQKVQSEEQWKKITLQTNEEIHSLKLMVSSLKTNSQLCSLTFQEKLQGVSQSLSNQLHCERASREDQQKKMINTMLKVVSYFE